MSELLESLARSLAEPMPRRRALMVVVGLMAAAVVPDALARPVVSRRTTCTPHPGGKKCTCPGTGVGHYEVCCPLPASDWDCQCGAPPNGYAACVPKKRKKCNQQCGKACCSNVEYCANAGNSLCCFKEQQPCGKKCCSTDEVCADASRSLCCPSGKFGCTAYGSTAGGAGQATCCSAPPQEYCTRDDQHAVCCEQQSSLCDGKCCELPRVCVESSKGRKACKCPPGMDCGDNCCKKTEHCCPGNTHCCPEGKTCCGDLMCCDHGEVCTRHMEGDKPVGIGACCPSSQAIGTSMCCKPGRFPKRNKRGGWHCVDIKEG